MAASPSTAIGFTVLKAFKQSARISQVFPCGVPGRVALPAQPPSYPDSTLSRLAVGLLQPRPPLPHGPGCKKVSSRHPYADGAAFFTQGSEVDFQEELSECRQDGV